MAEELDYKFAGLDIANSDNPLTKDYSMPRAAYYNYDESTYGINGKKFGLLYNYTAAKYLDDHLAELGIPAGWHVPTKADLETLLDLMGPRYSDHDWEWSYVVSPKLRSTDHWVYPGTDDYHFGLYPTGEARTQGANYYNLGDVYFESVNYFGYISSTTEYTEGDYPDKMYYAVSINGASNPSTARILMQGQFKHFCHAIRLVKNLT
jgi:uncharacterized protein (TIGR02145 family)